MRSALLAPPPQSLEHGGGTTDLSRGLEIRLDAALGPLAPAVGSLHEALARFGIANDAGAAVLQLRQSPTVRSPEAYRLEIDGDRLLLEAGGSAGAAYGLHTLRQCLEIHRLDGGSSAAVPAVRIDDWPDLDRRGVLLDVSRSRVPTMETLHELVDRLAGWKINQLQLYTEHTFAYEGHQEVWEGASPITPEQMRALDAYCADRHVELVPNQNSFGHLHRWLRHPRYRPLAECPDGLAHPFGDAIEPFSLCPTDPGSLDLLADLYDQLLPCFSSQQINVGLDETFDLGRGRSAARAEAVGVGQVYLEFLLQVHRLIERAGRRMQFWGDILAKHPEILAELPDDVIVMSWGYEADHDFTKELGPVRERGLEVYACPGTSSWLSFGGRVDNAVTNIANAALAATRAAASGCLVTDWGDQGHLQPLPISYPGFLAAASFCWNTAAARQPEDLRLAALLDTQLLADSEHGLGDALIELGTLYRRTGAGHFNGSALFHLVTSPSLALSHRRLDGLSAPHLENCRGVLGRVQTTLAEAPASLLGRELEWTTAALDLGAEIGLKRLALGASGSTEDLPVDVRRRLANRMDRLVDGHGALWAARSRPGGSAESRRVLETARATLLAGIPPKDDGE